MKKIILLFVLTATIIACQKNKNQEIKDNKVVWAETAQTILPLDRDTSWSEADWNAAYKYDKKQLFTSVTKAVLSGKLQAYASYPGTPFTVKEFDHFLVGWDSTNQVEDVNNPGVFISAPLKTEITPEEISQLRFHEKIEWDTVSYSLIRKVSYISFYTYRYNFNEVTNTLNVIGYKKLFDVKLNNEL